ncbi:MAG: PTS sugar transporter subunit IIA [Calditrichaeota bacterium]|nr:MAG: PTS sugar transporter subunit IIA [Calditrichota bacterium]
MQTMDLTNHFKKALFIPQMKATTKAEALEELLDLFVNEKLVKNKYIVLDMLNQRETLGSTGIGSGIAIPHGRTTATADVIIAFGRSQKGIDFDAIDHQPVHLFFMVIAHPNEQGNVYLPVLGSLVTILKDSHNREKLNTITTFEELVSVFHGE